MFSQRDAALGDGQSQARRVIGPAELLIHRKLHCFNFAMLGHGEPPEFPCASVLQHFRNGGRFMLLSRTARAEVSRDVS